MKNAAMLLGLTLLASVARAELPSLSYSILKNLETMKVGHAYGHAAAVEFLRYTFRQDCTKFLLESWLLEEPADRMTSFEIESDDYLSIGMSAGWLAGYQSELKQSYGQCQADISATHKKALRAKLADCRDRLEELGKDPLRGIMNAEEIQDLELPEDEETQALKRQLVEMAIFGRKAQAWVGALEDLEKEKSISCLALWPLIEDLDAPESDSRN